MSRLTPVEWLEAFTTKLAEDLEDIELAFISPARVEEYMEMYGDDMAGVEQAAELEKDSIEEVIRSARDDTEEDDEEDDDLDIDDVDEEDEGEDDDEYRGADADDFYDED